MRLFKPIPLLIFLVLSFASAAAALGIAATAFLVVREWGGVWADFRAPIAIAKFAAAFLIIIWGMYRLWMAIYPLREGEIRPGTPAETHWMVYSLFHQFYFNPVVFPMWIPIPLTGLVFRLLGARFGAGSYCGGVIHDPELVSVGRDVMIGSRALIVPHFQDGTSLRHRPIVIGDGAHIGAGATLNAGVRVGRGASVGMNSVVVRDTVIGDGESWAGIPARKV